jgi:hypothetical protein
MFHLNKWQKIPVLVAVSVPLIEGLRGLIVKV